MRTRLFLKVLPLAFRYSSWYKWRSIFLDMLHEDTLVLESVTLGLQVQLVVQVAINLLGLPISLKQPPENTHPHDPHSLLGGSGILGTLALTETSMPSLPACFVVLANARPGVDGDGLLDDQTIQKTMWIMR